MQPAITSIVNTYVRFGNRSALHELWRFRSSLKVKLLLLAGNGDPSRLLAQLDDEITIIEAGIAELSPAAAA